MNVAGRNGTYRSHRRSRFWVSVVTAVVAMFCMVCGLMLFEMRRDTWDRAVAGEVNLLNALSQDIARNVELYDLSLRAVVDGLAEPGFSGLSGRLQDLILFDRAAQASDLGAMLVLDRDGRVVRGSSPGFVGADLSDRSYFDALRADPGQGLYVSAPFRRRVTGGDDVIALARALRNPDGSFAGVVVGTLRLAYLHDLFARADLGPHGAINLFLRDGTRVMRVPDAANAIGRSMAGTANFERFAASGSGTFTSKAVVDGVSRVHSFLHVGKLPLILVVALSEDEVLSPWRTRATVIGAVLVILLVGAGVLARMRARSEEQYRLLADTAIDVVVRVDASMRRTYVSPSCRSVLGYEVCDLLGGSPRETVHPDDWPYVAAWMDAVRRGATSGDAVFRIRRKDGTYLWVEGRCRAVDGDGGCLTVMRDISERRAAEGRAAALTAELARLANCDGLTGLANRRRFDEALAAEGAIATRDGTPLSLLLLDVDRFKAFNDRYGHQDGDACLRRVADAVQAAVAGADALVARYGGEELAVLLPGTDAPSAAALGDAVRRAVEGLGLSHAGNAFGVVTVSVGCATALAAEGLIAAADARLYGAKRAGRNRVVSMDGSAGTPGPGSDEVARLAAVARCEESGASARSDSIDRIARMTAHLHGAPIALVSVVEAGSMRLVGRHGIDAVEAVREEVLRDRTVREGQPLVAPGADADPRFSDLPILEYREDGYAVGIAVDHQGGTLGRTETSHEGPEQFPAHRLLHVQAAFNAAVRLRGSTEVTTTGTSARSASAWRATYRAAVANGPFAHELRPRHDDIRPDREPGRAGRARDVP